MIMMSPSPSTSHQSVSGELEFIMKQSCKSEYVIYDAPLDVILSPKTVLQPDIMMIHRSRLHIVTKRGIEGSPDLVVEIVSPGSRKRDKVDKLNIYAKFAIAEYWVVDIDARTLEQYHLLDDRYELVNLYEVDEVITSDKLFCVSIVLSDIFIEL